jgi:dipeptidyl aminopeptidase/acylaminoacyl peptidase
MRWWFGCFAAFSVSASTLAVAAPLEAYGRLPAVEDVQISPDGASLAFGVTDGEKRRIVVKRLSVPTNAREINLDEVKLRGLQWADPQHLLVTTSVSGFAESVRSRPREWFKVHVYDPTNNRWSPLLTEAANSMNVTNGGLQVRFVNGRTEVFVEGVNFNQRIGNRALLQTDFEIARAKVIETGDARSRDWVVDSAGQPVAEAQYWSLSGKWALRIRTRKGGWMESRTLLATTDVPTLHGLGRDGRSVLVELLEDGKLTLHEISTIDGAWGPAIPAPYGKLFHDPATHAWIGQESLDGDVLSDTFFDPQLQRDWNRVTESFPGEQVHLVSFSADRRKLVILVDGPTHGAAFAIVDFDTTNVDWIGYRHPEVKPDEIAEVRPIKYKAADGLVITGYVTLPRGKPAKNLPLVVLPHSSPEARDEPGFDWWAQAIAARGYAVLQPNFRGSAGFGEAFVTAGDGQWGRKMQTDLSDGARYLASEAIIDAKRVCIVGDSYGGYAALAGAAFEPGVYRCAVSVAGPSDLRRYREWQQNYGRANQNEATRSWDRFLGAKSADDPSLDAISPADQADKVTIPVLLIHGKDDTVVPFEQSQIMADALARAGHPATIVTLKNEDH